MFVSALVRARVCVCVCIHICSCIYVNLHIDARVYVQHINIYMYVYTYACMYVYGEDLSEAPQRLYACIIARKLVSVHVYVCTHTCVKRSCSLSNFGCQTKTVCSNFDDASG